MVLTTIASPGLAAASTARPALLDTTSSQTLTGGTLTATEVQMDTTRHANQPISPQLACWRQQTTMTTAKAALLAMVG